MCTYVGVKKIQNGINVSPSVSCKSAFSQTGSEADFGWSLLETIQAAFLARELYCYTIVAIVDPATMIMVDR